MPSVLRAASYQLHLGAEGISLGCAALARWELSERAPTARATSAAPSRAAPRRHNRVTREEST